MSAEEGSAPAPKAAATFSSFINKNTTGKKFAPKAARRRPGATPAALAPTPSEPEPAAESVVVPPASQTEPSSSRVPTTEPSPAQGLPTPAATQEVPLQDALAPALPSAREVQTVAADAPPSQPSLAEGPLPTPVSTGIEAQAEQDITVEDTPAEAATDEESISQQEPVLPSKEPIQQRQRARRSVRETTISNADGESRVAEAPVPSVQAGEESRAVVAAQSHSTSANGNVPEAANIAEQDATVSDSASQPRRNRRLPWVAVNHPREDGGEGASAPPKKSFWAGRRRKAKVTDNGEDAAATEEPANDDRVVSRKRAGAKTRGKRKAAEVSEDDFEDPPPVGKPRKTRKTRQEPVATTENGEEFNVEAVSVEAGAEATPAHRKPRTPKRKKRTSTEEEGGVEGGQGPEGAEARAPKRKGRPPRAATPSDAEDHVIDPENTFMDSLASRDLRFGKVSNRERKMREINWVEVRERWRAEDRKPILSAKELQAQADKALKDAAANQEQPVESGPRMIEVNGVIQIVQSSGTLDREAEADRLIEGYEIVEDDDLTTRITSRSFLKNNKRFPNDFLLPGQGMRWNTELTDLFYQGLRNFGTDFQMISKMFPGATRRSIKLKFTREEREHPHAVKQALHGQSEMVSHWDKFLDVANLQNDSFADADKIRREMDAHEAEMREKIDKAKAEAEERRRQKQLAGEMDDGNGDTEEVGKENEKGKKKRKAKQVAFQDEPGVEIVEGGAEGWVEQQA